MQILIFAIIVLIVAGLLIWALDSLPLANPLNIIVKVAVILVAALIIVNRAGLI